SWRSRALLGCLALLPGGTETLGRLGALLWPDRPRAEATRLAQRAARTLGERVGGALRVEDGAAILDPALAAVDLAEVAAGVSRGEIADVLIERDPWPARVLADFDGQDAALDTWLAVVRGDWQARLAATLEAALARFETADDGLKRAATALLRIEPGHERAARRLIEHYHAVGNPAAALEAYEAITRHLDARFGIAPQPETRAAADAARAPAPAPAPVPADGGTSLLRLHIPAFEAGGADDAGLGEGLRSELVASLAGFRGWATIETGRQSGPAPAADFRLTGRLGRTDAPREISVALEDGQTGRHIWAQSYPLNVESFRDTRRRLVGKIAASLEVYVSTDRLSARSPDPAFLTVDKWLRAERLFTRWTPADHDGSVEILDRLVKREPDFAPGLASLAGKLNVAHIVRPGIGRDPARQKRAQALAERAVELDPLDARNQMALAWSSALEGGFEKASVHMDYAARLNPNSPRTLVSCAMGFAFLGEHDRAREILEHCLACAPVLLDYQWCYAASVHYLGGDPEAALDAVTRARDRIIDNQGWRAVILSRLGRPEEAAEALAKLIDDVRGDWSSTRAPTAEAVIEWFLEAYPLRREEEREALAEPIRLALAQLHQKPGG
ncbi:MAG: BTAD domain-containing putative transcriptional regulator, partial [Pseudomonadota bacterium]